MEQLASRRLLGATAVIAVGLLSDFLPSGPSPTYLLFGEQHVFVPTLWIIFETLVIFAVGGFISRRGFIPVAVTIAVLSILFSQYVLYQIALPTGQASVIGAAVGNIPNMISALASAVVGANLGEWLYSRMKGPSPCAVEGDV